MSRVRIRLVVMMLMGLPLAVRAEQMVARMPLNDGRIEAGQLVRLMAEHCGWEIDPPATMSIDLNGLRGSLLIRAMNQSLGDGGHLTIADDELVLSVDPERLPHSPRQLKQVVRTFTSVAAPSATADQNRLYGLLLPNDFDPARPLVVLVHGLDCTREQWSGLARRLNESGRQVAYFTFPSDQPLVDSAELLSQHLTALHETFGQARVSVLTYAMGALVARGCLENADLQTGVDRLIMLAPPNHGSKWARLRLALEIEEHYNLWRTNPDWKWTWPITDGLGEAGADLSPSSLFLEELNDRPRRSDIHYSIIAGNQHPVRHLTANLIAAPAGWIPREARSWWGLRQTRNWIKEVSEEVRDHPDRSDGPVKVSSAMLEGVEDVVMLRSDHARLLLSTRRKAPIVWAAIDERLAR